jgi:hypothetical protein
VEDRQREGRGLAGAGLGDAADIAAVKDGLDRLRLDRRRCGVACIGQRLENGRAEGEIGK